MLDVAEYPAEKQARERRAGELDDDVAGHALPREVPAQRECQRHCRVEVRSRYGAHEQDDRGDHQARGDDGRCQADLPLRVQQPAAGGNKDQCEGAQQLGELPPPFLARVVEIRAVPELKPKHVMRAREGRPQRLRVDLMRRRVADGDHLLNVDSPELAIIQRHPSRVILRIDMSCGAGVIQASLAA